jgi:hypothetical protein
MQRQSNLRLAFTTVADQALLAVVLGAGGAHTLPMLWAVFLFLIGAGGRYGKRALALSCGTALVGIVALSVLQPWWMINRSAALGIGLSVLGASIYLAVLVGRLGSANRDLALKAGTDPLTGLSNRYMLEQTIGRAVMAISDRTGRRDGAAADRSRRLQGSQRYLRPRSGRRRAANLRGASGRKGKNHRHSRAARRR